MEIRYRSKKDLNDKLRQLVRSYGSLVVSTDEGVFSAAPAAFTAGLSESTVTLLITARLST
jgi:ribosomal protein S8